MTEQRLILKTPRLTFVMWDEGDAALVQQLHSTVATTRYLSGNVPWSLQKAEERLHGWFEEQARDGTTKYKLLAEDGRFVGRAGISKFRNEQFELGYSLREDAWGKGLATEAASALADWFFGRELASGFIAFTHPENTASQHVLRKIGMRERAPILVDGVLDTAFELTAEMRWAKS
ncbi:GNAT family N-acetyltransferase [Rhizobium leguminosarum]|uniref:GNAT family N-acetyltransferase n=1 Tax=Rhizobium leguminosarum TaxID=384 RepID=UPI001A921467|nr:GNAT family N-acetyltransferase [Rhizobium leguminosarum]MBY5552098.1 GNAT family N-acetyltransferase [Rhizobium leguminosarum]MBY5638758.1 GNAT family N-acetyltransferase [Rhizobium leguminosarum]MBY5691959.1 GNAT family N-acetyltransferase [Rhizobium leguminosarum]MBY5726730.1 GNAT family N-acetyltransferase [Rhizobium leguminosarum]QSW25418.1 GNAT family N-acetyltransferase [Rhizobium leguminosarum]